MCPHLHIRSGSRRSCGYYLRCSQPGRWLQHSEPVSVRFQSLSGFQVRCNPEIAKRARYNEYGFQSLSGFQVRCNDINDDGSTKFSTSFNPYRVFKFVATRSLIPLLRQITSFNPYRVFKFVATSWRFRTDATRQRFQSLSGFQVRCNNGLPIDVVLHGAVSIPIGFSSSLQLSSLVDK